MNINEIIAVFALQGRTVTECDIEGYYKVDGGKHRSLRSLVREANGILNSVRRMLRSVRWCLVAIIAAFRGGNGD